MKKFKRKKKRMLTALAADSNGEIFELDGYAAAGMAGNEYYPLTTENSVSMPFGGELMYLPDRNPVVYNIENGIFETLTENPFNDGEPLFAVACFNSPGYVHSYISAYTETGKAGFLPLFSYGAVGWHEDQFRSAVILVDTEKRQDLRLMKQENVMAGIQKKRKQMPGNRLRAHLENCALTYGCPAGKNFFLERYEAPLPTSNSCNARCMGCISLQDSSGIPNSQDRIDFTPTPEEIAEVATSHILKVKNSVVSFGQGCEGDPLLAHGVIEPAIRIIRSKTDQGTINMNTNGSRPEVLEKLFKAGLNSVRISMNSVREDCYLKYFRPKGYHFSDVIKSIDLALNSGKFVSVNYLNCPGFTDTLEEFNALIKFLKKYPINMIQWRNLNYDPLRYWKEMNKDTVNGKQIGIEMMIKKIKKIYPNLKHGYFNPPKEKMGIIKKGFEDSRSQGFK